MTEKKVLLVDDDRALVTIIVKYLEKYDFKVTSAYDGKEIDKLINAHNPDIILLDIMLPEKDGFAILKEVQKEFDIPVIMLTARGEEIDRVIGLEMGADDYITKPFSMRELVARIRAVLRRNSFIQKEVKRMKEITFDTLKIIPTRRALLINEEEIELTRTEFDLLYVLASYPERTFTREQLLGSVTDREYALFDRSIDMHISHLRNKLKKQKPEKCVIKTVWGIGYKFEVED